jgi:integrase/recombinase XerD
VQSRYEMARRRTKELSIKDEISPRSFCATGIMAYLENGGTIEHARQIAAREPPRTTKLYDRTSDAVSLDEVERITI